MPRCAVAFSFYSPTLSLDSHLQMYLDPAAEQSSLLCQHALKIEKPQSSRGGTVKAEYKVSGCSCLTLATQHTAFQSLY